MAQREWLELQPGTEAAVSGFRNQDKVFVTDAEKALPVYPGFVGDYHSRHQGLAVETLADVVRTFVDVEVEAHPVAGTVAVIALGFPKGIPGQDIEMAACGPFGEHRPGKTYMSFEDKGIILFLQVRAGSEGNGAGDIGGAEKILTPGIYEIEAPGFDQRRSGDRSRIMWKGGVGAVGRYGLETVSPVSFNLGPE